MRGSLLAQVVKPIHVKSRRTLTSWTAESNTDLNSPHTNEATDVGQGQSEEAYRRKRKTEWKRRQRGQSFLDFAIINVRGGTGGNGCVAFHREKYKPFGPPSGGNGGRGGDVYILPTPHLTTLSSIPKRIRGENGTNGMGSWQNGRSGSPLVIKVPLGTLVKELPRDDPRRSKDEYEAEEEGLEGLGLAERRQKIRDSRWLHYPGYDDTNVERDAFKEAEQGLFAQERERRRARRLRSLNPIKLDLDKIEETVVPDDAPLGTGHRDPLGHLVASGGQGGVGNPHFLSQINRSPKFATRGYGGERRTFSLELKLLADIGLVGFPNAGKSTLLRALTGGRAKTEVASYAFTTLNPVVGVVRVADDGTFEGAVQGQLVYDETLVEMQREMELLEDARTADSSAAEEPSGEEYEEDFEAKNLLESDTTPNSREVLRPGHHFDIVETFRFTIADNPGLISRASENVGLGHSFLRSMERSLALVYVVDLAGPAPWDELRVLRAELEKYKPGMSAKARMVIANKADLFGGEEGNATAVEEAKRKLQKLEEFVRTDLFLGNADGNFNAIPPPLTRPSLDVIPVSAKFCQNLRKVVGLLRTYVEDVRRTAVKNTATP